MSTTPPERDWDAEFAEIAAHLEGPTSNRSPQDGGASRVHTAPETPPHSEAAPTDTAAAEAAPQNYVPRQHIPPEEDDEEFVPAAPAPLPHDDPMTMIMIGSLVIGPVWLGWLALFARESRQLWWILAALVCVLGLTLAIVRQPRSRDEDDPDDGARV